ncbi:MAG: hypothetical protein WAM91_13160 [Candidatus Acidiferrales bacterium]
MKAFFFPMADYTTTVTPPRSVPIELARYSPELPMTTLVVGVDNIHHDVYLSPAFYEATRVFLFDLIRQTVNLSHFPGFERKPMRAPEAASFRRMLGELLQASLTRAKFEKNVERDILLRVSLLHFFAKETVTRFSDLLLEAKEGIRARGSYFERSEQAHVLKSRLAEIQAGRRDVYRQIGQHLYQIWNEIEETSVARSRKALFGDEAAGAYEILNNRLIFVDGGRDDRLYLEHYVLLGNYQKDPDRFEIIDHLMLDLLREHVLPGEPAAHSTGAAQSHSGLVESAVRMRADLERLDTEREDLFRRLERSEDLLGRMLRREDPADIRAALTDVDRRRAFLQEKLDLLAPQIDSARQKKDFLDVQHQTKLDDYLDEPANARRLFDNTSGGGSAEFRGQLLDELLARLERQGILFSVLASYELRNLHHEYCPPLHLQQLRKALVSRDDLKRAEDVLKQFPAKQFSLKRLEDASRRLNRLSREEQRGLVLRFAEDFMRLRRDLHDYQRLTTAMERVNLIHDDRTRDLSRLNRTLYEFLLPEEDRPEEDHVVSHAVIKADVRGSTKMTQELLSRGLNPASHLSLNLYEPVQRVLERYGASKVFIEGDAIVMAIYETESNRSRQRAVAKSCLLSRHIVGIAAAYNERSEAGDLPRLELGVGVAFQGSPPTYWMDNDSRIMISRALNLSDRLSSCSKAVRRLLGNHGSPFRLFVFQTTMEGATEEELDEFLLRYNLNGIELNEEGFQKLSEEISLGPLEAECKMPWGRERVTFYSGLVPVGETLEPLLIRKGFVRQLLPDGKIGAAGTRAYYEVCTNFDLPGSVSLGNQDARKR